MPLAKIIDLFRTGNLELESHGGNTVVTVQPAKPSADKRLCPRIKYHSEAAPLIHIGKQVFKVIDLSKTGVRFVLSNSEILRGNLLEGTIRIFDGTCIRFRGATIREDYDAGIVVIQFMQTEYLLD